MSIAPLSPITNTAPASTHSLVAKAQISRHTASSIMAPTSDFFSPNRSAITPAGRAPTRLPMPISATTRAASATDAPSARAVSGTSGTMAPKPTNDSVVGR